MIGLWAWLWWNVVPVRKRLAVESYRRAFPERDPAELAQTMGEIIVSYLDLIRGRRAKMVDIQIVQPGSICICGHGVSWDLGLISAAEHLPITIFVKTPANPVAAAVIARLRGQADLELLPPRGSMEQAYAALARGRVVAFVQDQRHNAGLPVPFFGRPARTSPAFAAMAWRTRAPLYGAWPSREADGTYLARFQRLDWEIPEDREEAVQRLTAQSAAWYEAQIRTRPRAWLWLHDRWR